MTVEGTTGAPVLPLWLMHEDEVDAWRAAQAAHVAAWLGEQNFKGEKHRVLLLPDRAGGACMAVGGLGKRQGELSLWHAAGIVERLAGAPLSARPALRATPRPRSSPRLRLRRLPLRALPPGKSRTRGASIEPPANADAAFVALAAESLRMARDWINTPASDLGPAELAAAARALAERHRAAIGSGWARSSQAQFPGHPCGRAREHRRAAAARAAPGRRPTRGRSRADARRQGRVLRQRRPRHQAGLGHGADEKRHGRRGRGAGARAHADERGAARRAARC